MAVAEFAALDAAQAEGLTDVEVRVRPLDRRLRPALCDQPLEIIRPNVGNVLGPVSYGVQCPGSVPWTLYLRADVSASIDVPVLRRSMARGDLISAQDIDVVRRRITTRAADLIVDPDALIGMEVIRPMPAGSTLRQGQVDYPVLITRGQSVTLIAGGGGLEVRMQGKAMGNGAAGDRLVVTNTSSGRRVEGIVQSDGSVQIP
jgi:flagella basal body P-ring formation protein FlgA